MSNNIVAALERLIKDAAHVDSVVRAGLDWEEAISDMFASTNAARAALYKHQQEKEGGNDEPVGEN